MFFSWQFERIRIPSYSLWSHFFNFLVTLDEPLLAETRGSLLLQETWDHGEEQPAECRNAGFALIFLLQLGIVIFLAIKFCLQIGDLDDDAGNQDDDKHGDNPHLHLGFLYFNLCVAGGAIILSSTALALYGAFSELMIKVSLVMAPIVVLATAIFGDIVLKNAMYAILGGISFLWTAFYTCNVWKRIPFAAANLSTAMEAVHANYGITIVSFVSLIETTMFPIVWIMAFVWVYTNCSTTTTCDDSGCETHSNLGMWVFWLFLLSLYWTTQVIKNMLHTTVAGVVGTWWFAPSDAASCCSKALLDSLFRTSTYSLGSICFGSLVVALVQVLQFMIHMARSQGQRRNNLCLCLLECLVSRIEQLIQYVNKWAFGKYRLVGLFAAALFLIFLFFEISLCRRFSLCRTLRL
jgi:hypothetical protein